MTTIYLLMAHKGDFDEYKEGRVGAFHFKVDAETTMKLLQDEAERQKKFQKEWQRKLYNIREDFIKKIDEEEKPYEKLGYPNSLKMQEFRRRRDEAWKTAYEMVGAPPNFDGGGYLGDTEFWIEDLELHQGPGALETLGIFKQTPTAS